MMSGRDALLCGLLKCGIADLSLLDDVEYCWEDVFDKTGWDFTRFPDITLNSLMREVFAVGVSEIEVAVDDRIAELEAIPNERPLDEDEEEELRLLRTLEPGDDIQSFHNFLDTHIWFERNGEVYRDYLPEALDKFCRNTGFEIGGDE